MHSYMTTAIANMFILMMGKGMILNVRLKQSQYNNYKQLSMLVHCICDQVMILSVHSYIW